MSRQADLEWIPGDPVEACAHLLKIVREQNVLIAEMQHQIQMMNHQLAKHHRDIGGLSDAVSRAFVKLEEMDG